MRRNSQMRGNRASELSLYSVFSVLVGLILSPSPFAAEIGSANEAEVEDACAAQRPEINFNRWREDWGVLADPCVKREPFDSLKYIPLSDDPAYYLSLGFNLRDRLEVNNAAMFGVNSYQPDSYIIQRAEIHADLRLGDQVQIFTQLFDAKAYQKKVLTPVDENPLDLEQAFITITEKFDDGALKWRLGRQEMAFDLQRFVSVRDGPNIRQAFDAAWVDWESDSLRVIGFASQPVQYANVSDFDDYSDRHLRFNGLRVEKKNFVFGEVSFYLAQFDRDNAVYLNASGQERRDVLDLHNSGKLASFDWDVEVMDQAGSVGTKTISAWAIGSVVGYSIPDFAWHPHLALQFDAASGNRHSGNGDLGTFNPLFPNGYYFSQAGYSGDSNIIHLKPTISFAPNASLNLMGGVGLQWRETIADAVYAQGPVAVPNTAGRGERWTGIYEQVRAEQKFSKNLFGSVEAVHFQVGDTLRQAGGGNSNYLGIELKYCW